ncbi:hypothetical protein [Saccharibacillus deserti]|uniref:hypothetical protein n=1 Tax=Saccharibacillus deserti TaxID=1634444 RepID=UPI0031B63EA2
MFAIAEQIVVGVEEEMAAERGEREESRAVPAPSNPVIFFTPVLIDSRAYDRYLG